MGFTRDVANFGSAGTMEYIPELFAMEMQKEYYLNTVFREITNTKYEGQIKKMGDKINIRVVPTITINDYDMTADLTYETPGTASKEMLIDQGKSWSFKLDDVNALQMDVPMMKEMAADAAMRLDIALDTEVLAYMSDFGTTGRIAASNFGATAGAITSDINLGTTGTPVSITADNAVDYIVYANQVLDEANVPSEGRWMVLPSWYIARLKTGDLKRADITGDSSAVLRTGLIGMVDRTKLYQSNNLLEGVGAEAGNFNILFGVNDATAFAMQLTKTETVRLESQFGDAMRGLCVYGRSTVKNDAMGLLYAKAA